MRVLSGRFDVVIGVAVCGVTAVLSSIALSNSTLRARLPIFFVLVILLIAARFGTAAGVLGCLLSGGIFAIVIFDPRGSLAVTDAGARANLGWMVLGGVSLSFLLGHQHGHSQDPH